MFKLRDFIHLPQLDPLIEQVIHDSQPGTINLVAGPEARPQIAPARDLVLPSGRGVFVNILLGEILSGHRRGTAAIVSRDKSLARPPRELKHRVEIYPVEPDTPYSTQIAAAAARRPVLLLVDVLSAESAEAVAQAAAAGLTVLAQLDTVLWGAEAARQAALLWPELFERLGWVLTVQRFAGLCPHCKSRHAQPTFDFLQGRYPNLGRLEDLFELPDLTPRPECTYYQPGACSHCQESGRAGEIFAFDLFRTDHASPNPFEQPSRLSLEEYLLRLAAAGYLPLEDLLRLERDLLRRTYNTLLASERAITQANQALNSKLVQLEAANRVLVQRTEAMVSLREIGQALISSVSLEELASRLCQRASELAGADRAVLYVLHVPEDQPPKAEISAVKGWEPPLPHRPVNTEAILADLTPDHAYVQVPPGVTIPRSGSSTYQQTRDRLRAGVRLPLVAQGQPTGLLIVQATHKASFTPAEISLLETLASQAAVAIQRAGLIDTLHLKIEQLEAAQAGLIQKERLEHELELARQVQQSMIPRTFPIVPGFAFAGQNIPARQVGGDFYDVFALDEGRFGIVIGDVSDKGMPSALYMALTRSLLVAEARREASPSAVLTRVNRLLLELGELSRFVSVFYGVIDARTRHLTYARAGHDRPILLHAGNLTHLQGEGAILGILEDDELHISEEELLLQPGERLVLYSDGLTDVLNPQGQFFELPRFESLLKNHATTPLPDLCQVVFTALRAYQSSAEQFDDMTLLVVEVDSEGT